MNVGAIGCGFVIDFYMGTWARHPGLTLKGVADIDAARRGVVSRAYKVKAYDSNEALLADPDIEIVANFTSVESHFEVTRQALAAGKHVYSEKPLAMTMDQARELFALAEQKGVRLSCAPSNAMSDTVQTMWKAVRDGAVGDVRIVYAEFDDNVIYLMHPETWRSPTGAPWPYRHEYEVGCTHEHVGYHLTWLCAMFGPVKTVTSFSKRVIPDKTDRPLDPADTPDFSVACLDFHSGVVARVTCSIGVPLDHRMRIFGNRGALTADTYRHYQCPVYLERFTQLTLNARKARTVRTNSFLSWIFGVGGRPARLLRIPPPGAGRDTLPKTRWWSPGDVLRAIKRREVGQQDKTIGIAELADAIKAGRPSFPPPDFTLHLTELTIAIQGAGTAAPPIRLKTTFEPIEPQPETLQSTENYARVRPPGFLSRTIERSLVRMHDKR
jgi:predicted dehydrogenase